MHWKPRGWTLIGMLLLMLPGAVKVMTTSVSAQVSQIATTQVTDTVYLADGTLARGTVIVSWQTFTTAIGQSVPAGSTSAVIGTGGVLSVALAPNAGATPMGSYYTAIYHLSDGSVSREFWVVPVSQTPVQVSTIESTVLPTSVAMQTVSKSYVDTAIATAISGHPLDDTSPYVIKTGDTMTGPLGLPGDPTTANQAADKHYVDTSVTALGGGLGQKVALLPPTTQTVVQPVGTQLQVNNLNGEEYASQYVTGLGNNGILNAVSSPDCACGCDVKVEHSYGLGENYTSESWNSGAGGTHVEDDRNGQRRDNYLNPTSAVSQGEDAGQVIDVVSTRNAAAEFASGAGSDEPSSLGLVITHEGLTGGSNLFPATIETVPYFKSNYSALDVSGTYNTMGQHVLAPKGIHCYGVGDCLIGSQFLTASGGFRDEADEGTHPLDIQVMEDTAVFRGACSQGCTTGSTSVTINPTVAPGTQGEGRYLIDLNPAHIFSTGQLTGGSGGTNILPGPEAIFSGTNFPVSVFLATAQTATSQANNVAPGTLTMPIATSGVAAGFATNTAAIASSSGVACVTEPAGDNPHNYEMVNYTVVDGTHLQMTFNKVHRSGATIAIGGLCGYGLEETVDTARGIRQVFPVMGSYSPTGLYYAGGSTPIVGVNNGTGGYLNLSGQISEIARSNNVVTLTMAGNLPADVNGLTMTVSGVTDSSYNGSFSVTTTGPYTLTYADSGANSTSAGGTVSIVTGGYALYPMAEVLGVFNPLTKKVDGQMTLAPNSVAWATNDTVEQPHYYEEGIAADTTYISQTTPRAALGTSAGLTYELSAGPGIVGWIVNNSVPASNYLGNGGTHGVPSVAYSSQGIWQRTMDMQAGEQSVFSVHCNSHGCGKWNSGYDLFELDNSVYGVDSISFQPSTSVMTMGLRGAAYQFTPQAFVAGTVNAQTINATTINGSVSAASITSGTMNASRLPVFGSSGGGHAAGAVPDPGVTAGTTRYLREDGTWATPSGGGSTGGSSGGTTGTATLPGATADYNFLQASGTVLTDASGNGNSGTLGSGALAPTWTATGLNFSGQQQVALPAALNGTQTFFFAVYINPLSSGPQPNNSYPMLAGGSTGASGLNLMYGRNIGGVYYGSAGPYAPGIFAAGNPMTSGTTPISGFHVLAYVLGTGAGSVDHLYVDGVEQPSYDRQNSSAGIQTSGNLFLGSSNTDVFTSSGFLGTMYRVITYPANTLTTSQIQSVSGSIRNDAQSRGVPVVPQPIPQITPTLNCIGDSITVGYGASSPYCSMLSLTNQPNYTIVNWGISGITVSAIGGSEANRVAPRCTTINGPANALVFAGTNDFTTISEPVYSVFEALMGEVQTLKTAGCRVFVGTMLSRTGSGTVGTLDGIKDTYDALILTQAKADGADGVVDFAANPLLGADGAYASSTYFNSDGTHPTTVGQGLLAMALSNVLNYTYGFNKANPNVVTAATYQMLSGDGAITAAPTTNATYTAPDCIGPSGVDYVISNPQSAFAVSVVGMSGEPINGLTTPIVVPANSSVTLHDVANPKSVSGCHWVM
jgi:lysophospholipase L1-like esterase